MKDINTLTEDEIMNMSTDDYNHYVNEIINPTKSQSLDNNDNNSNNSTIDNNSQLTQQTKEDDNTYLDKDENNNVNDIQEDNNDINDNNNNINNISSNDNNSSTDDNNSVDDNKAEETKYKVKANGQMYELNIDELIKLAQRGFGYTAKMQQIKPFRQRISAMEENKITDNDLFQFIEMKKGNREAIANFLKKNNYSPYDLDMSEKTDSYTPKEYGEKETYLKEVIDELEQSPKYPLLQKYVSNLDSKSRDLIISDPNLLKGLMTDIENGVFDLISPEANKRALFDNNIPMLQHYIAVATEKANEAKNKAQMNNKSIDNSIRNDLRNKTKISGNKSYKQPPQKVVNMIDDISNEDFENFLESIGMDRNYFKK